MMSTQPDSHAHPNAATAPRFSIVTVNYNNAALLQEVMARTLKALRGLDYEVIVVDNGSSDDSLAVLSQHYEAVPRVRVLASGRNGGFGFGCNCGARAAQAPVLWFLNSDAWIADLTGLQRALDLVLAPGTGMLGTTALLQDGSVTPQAGSDMSFSYFMLSSFRPGRVFRSLPLPVRAALIFLLRRLPGIFGRYASSHEHAAQVEPYAVRGVGGASFLVERHKFEERGGFDEGFFLYDEDGDLCLRFLAAGLTNYIEPTVTILNYLSATTSKVPKLQLKHIKRASRLRLVRKHFSGLQRILLTGVTKLTWKLL
jgi:N-acetylglucosaminyl-diphospho-decaprenol L-rhamnosyltransferase